MNAHTEFSCHQRDKLPTVMRSCQPTRLMNFSQRQAVWQTCAIILLLAGAASAVDLSRADFDLIKKAQKAYSANDLAKAGKLLETLRPKYPQLNQLRSRSPLLYRRLTAKYPVLTDIPRVLAAARKAQSRKPTPRQPQSQKTPSGKPQSQKTQSGKPQSRQTQPRETTNRRQAASAKAAPASPSSGLLALRSLLETKPESASLHWQLGSALLRKQQFRAGAVELQTAWYLGQVKPQIPLALAALWQQVGDDRQALAWLQRAVAMQKKVGDSVQLQFAELCWKQKEFSRAEKAAQRLLKSKKMRFKSQAHVLLGQIALENKKLDVAIEHWKQAVATGLASPKLTVAVGAHCYNSGDFAAAAKYLQMAVANEKGKSEENLRFLVLSLMKQHQPAKAREYLRQYIELHGPNENARKLIRLIALSPKSSGAAETAKPSKKDPVKPTPEKKQDSSRPKDAPVSP